MFVFRVLCVKLYLFGIIMHLQILLITSLKWLTSLRFSNTCVMLCPHCCNLWLQETEQMMPASLYYNEYMYAPAGSQLAYDSAVAVAAVAENVQVENSVAWYELAPRFVNSKCCVVEYGVICVCSLIWNCCTSLRWRFRDFVHAGCLATQVPDFLAALSANACIKKVAGCKEEFEL